MITFERQAVHKEIYVTIGLYYAKEKELSLSPHLNDLASSELFDD